MPFCYRQAQVEIKNEEVQTMKNINPKLYEIRFWRFVFTLLIQVMLLMAVATGLYNLSGGNSIVGVFVVVACGFIIILITRIALVYIDLLKTQLTIEMKAIYGIELEKEIEELNLPETEEEKIAEKGGSRSERLFGLA